MNKQRKRNISLLILSAVMLITITMISQWSGDNNDSLDVDRNKFSLKNTIDVTRVIAKQGSKTTELAFTAGKWMLNDVLQADPTKVHLLFATIQQASIRRPVGRESIDSLITKLKGEGTELLFYENDNLVLQFSSIGNEDKSVTYFQGDDGEIYLMEIPGYRAYIHGLVSVNSSSWRNHNLFHRLNWRNLASLSVTYPDNPERNIKIIQGSRQFEVEGIYETDTTRLFDFVDFISLVEADNYIPQENAPKNASVIIKVDVRDVGNRPYILELLNARTEESLRIGRMDSMVYFAIPEDRIAPLFANPDYFEK